MSVPRGISSLRYSRSDMTKFACAVVTLVVAITLLVMGASPRHLVDRGRGELGGAHVSCTFGRHSSCDDGVYLTIPSTNQLLTVTNERLYKKASDTARRNLPVTQVYVDTSDGKVNKLTLDGTRYVVETPRLVDLALGLGATALALAFLGWLSYPRYRARRR